jgi:MurNAc alpha-1-phosphate uridylyltransferase
MAQGLVSGIHHEGAWHDIGTPERLQALYSQLLNN